MSTSAAPAAKDQISAFAPRVREVLATWPGPELPEVGQDKAHDEWTLANFRVLARPSLTTIPHPSDSPSASLCQHVCAKPIGRRCRRARAPPERDSRLAVVRRTRRNVGGPPPRRGRGAAARRRSP